jgi:hypothetical protein
MSGRLTRLAANAPQTKPICTPIVSHEMAKGERCHSRFNSGVIAVAENHVVNDRTIAIDRIARTRQREASELRCKPDAQVDGVVGIVALVVSGVDAARLAQVYLIKKPIALDYGPIWTDRGFFRPEVACGKLARQVLPNDDLSRRKFENRPRQSEPGFGEALKRRATQSADEDSEEEAGVGSHDQQEDGGGHGQERYVSEACPKTGEAHQDRT